MCGVVVIVCHWLSIYLEDSEALALLTEPAQAQLAMSLVAGLPLSPEIILYNDPTDPASSDTSISLPDPTTISEDDLAYIMFTSGSTGRPKGVMIPHRGVRDLVAFNVEHFALDSSDVFCLNSTVCFDSYVTYVFAALTLGAKLVVPGPTAHLDPHGMAALIAAQDISCMEVVPALASEYLDAFREAGESIACLRCMLTGGEALTPKLAEEICATLPGLHRGGLFNSYGPTEVTVTTITGHIKAPFDRIPLGRPDHNVHTYVVLPDTAPAGSKGEGEISAAAAEEEEEAQPTRWRLAEVGEPGELWLSGPRLARGYRNRPDQTAAAYVPNPWWQASTAALDTSDPAAAALRQHYKLAYRSSDLVVMGADGQLEYLGRADRQIKINGVRMEVSEVEAVLAGAPGVTHAAVKPWKDPNGCYRLAGYVAPDSIDLAAAEAHCRAKLLPAMVPAKLVSLPVMPRLPNGKIDVKSLAEPEWGVVQASSDGDSSSGGAAAAPSTDMEELLADIWAGELKVQKSSFSMKSNFFELGGNSLRAGLINSKIRRATGADISGLLIYQHSTVTAMAAAIESQCGKYAFTDVASRQGSFSMIGAGSCYQNSFSTAADRSADSRNSLCNKGWASMGQSAAAAAAAAAGGGGFGELQCFKGEEDGGYGSQGFGSRALPVWLATALQIGGLFLLGMLGYVTACGFLEASAVCLFALRRPLILLVPLYAFCLATGGVFTLLAWLCTCLRCKRPHILLVPLYAFTLATGGMFTLLAWSVALKWALLGRQKPGTHAIWSLYYVKWWLVRSTVKFSLSYIYVLVRRTPMFVWYLRALGCRIGRNVAIDSPNIGDWDMVEIGDNTVIEADSFIDGSSFHAAAEPGGRGTMVGHVNIGAIAAMVVGRVKIGKGVTMMPTSIASHGTAVPDGVIMTPGTTSQRLPAGPSDAEAHTRVRSEHEVLLLWLCMATVLLLVFVSSFAWLGIVPSILIWLKFVEMFVGQHYDSWHDVIIASRTCWIGGAYTEGLGSSGPIYDTCHKLWWTMAFSMLIAPGAAFVSSTIYMWSMIPLKWLVVPHTTEEKMKNGGLWLAWRRHLFKCLIAGPFQSIIWQFTSTEVYNAWLRALGAKIGRQCWLSEMFRCSEFELFQVEDTASMCSMVTVIGATSGRTAPVVLGEACDVTNDCTLLPGTTVGKNACLGVFTYGAPDQHFEDYSITLGGFKLRAGGAGADVEAGLASGKFESAASRLLPRWQYALYNVLYIAFSNTIFVTTTSMMSLPAAILGFYVLFHYGYFLGAAWAPFFLVFGFSVFLAYLAGLKRLLMPNSAGMRPIFKSVGAACWQLLCINAHLYADFNGFKGSLLYNWYLRAMGSTLGKNVFCLGGVVAEYDQVTIGDGTVIGDGAFLLTHTVEARHVKVRPITIGKQVTIGALSAVLPDAAMEDYATLREMSLVMKGETVPAGATWQGVPASLAMPSIKFAL
ncbi:hypothetical protein OEZ85_012770 [Tetradesmus obliquus]|uniref:Carrier domain-containing protein n=1 Tax=Tetradesmus obliquus TaxID=3088 RepID=A0ABY8U6I8_TETOB|nr:hypothetical protein OEZ85_012770 [Tetradesmus obliquus]